MIKNLLLFAVMLFNVALAAPFKTYTTDTAFSLSTQQNQDIMTLDFDIKPEHFLYKDKLKIKTSNVDISAINLPQASKHQDEFLGDTDVYTNHAHIVLNLANYQPNAQLKISFQGCRDGFCYPPIEKSVQIEKFIHSLTNAKQENLNIDFINKTAKTTAFKEQIIDNNEQSSVSIWGVFSFFLIGLGLAFTPCILPMLPIISSVILGNSTISKKRSFLLSLVYVQGMALSYTVLGLLIVAIGMPLQLVLQSPITLTVISALFIFLAFSMFGMFELSLPQKLTNKLNTLSMEQQSGSYKGVFVIGIITGFIASPCISAPLASMLLYIMQSGDYLKGGLSLFVLAQGIGTPLILVNVLGKQILPKSTYWTQYIKTAFGFIILAVPIFLVSRIISEPMQYILWSALATSFIIWVALTISTNFKYYKLAIVFCMLITGFTMQGFFYSLSHQQVAHSAYFKPLDSLKQIDKAVDRLKPNEVMMLDLRASWCTSCIEFEHKVFNQDEVINKLKQFKIYKMDFSLSSDEVKAVSKRFSIIGLPSILFFNDKGEIKDKRIQGFMNKDEFLQYLNTIKH